MDNKWNGCENDTDSKEPPRKLNGSRILNY